MDRDTQARMTQIEHIQVRTGKTVDELEKEIRDKPDLSHTALRDWFQTTYNLGYGDANTIAYILRNPDIDRNTGLSTASIDTVLDSIYSGKNAGLLDLHHAVMAMLTGLGEFEIAPKKTYLSLRRKKQFAMLGPGTKNRLELGLNMKDVATSERLEALPPGKMCQYRVFITDISQVDEQLRNWASKAYEYAG